MVSRTQLAIIPLLCLILAGLTGLLPAQTISIPDGPPLILPSSWPYVYDPPQVHVRIAVNPDSTISLISILGSEQELRPLVQEYLDIHGGKLIYANALPDPVLVDTIIYLDRQVTEYSTKISEAELRVQIEEWITQQRKSKSPYSLWGVSDYYPGLSPMLYRNEYNAIGLNRGYSKIKLKRSLLPVSMMSDVLYQGYFQAFYQDSVRLGDQDFDESRYHYPVTVTDLQAGMGDYEQRFARVSLKKNDLLGVGDMYYAFDLLAANGWWADASTAQTSMRHLLNIPIGPVEVELEYANYAQDIAMQQLRPVYWQGTVFPIEHRFRWLNAAIQSPYLDVSITSILDEARSTSFSVNPKNHVTLYKAGKGLVFGISSIRAAYEYAQRDTNISLAPDRSRPDYEHLIQAEYDLTGKAFSSAVEAGLYDWENPYLQARAVAQIGKITAGARFRKDFYDPMPQTSFPDIFTGTGTISGADIMYPQEYALQIGFVPYQARKISMELGRRKVRNYIPSGGSDVLVEAEPLFAGMNVSAVFPMGDFWLEWSQDLAWTQQAEQIRELPQWTFTGDICLTRSLNWDNALFAGLSCTGHSSYTSSHASAFLADTSSIWDARVGVRISKLFEISVAYRNFTDSTIYGAYPIPPTLQASLRWFYLN